MISCLPARCSGGPGCRGWGYERNRYPRCASVAGPAVGTAFACRDESAADIGDRAPDEADIADLRSALYGLYAVTHKREANMSKRTRAATGAALAAGLGSLAYPPGALYCQDFLADLAQRIAGSGTSPPVTAAPSGSARRSRSRWLRPSPEAD
jgi:hypothetical protein